MPSNASNIEQNRSAPRSTSPMALVLLLVVGSLLALSIVVSKLAITGGAQPLQFLIATMFGAGVLLSVLVIATEKKLVLNRRTLEYGLIAGALYAVPNLMGYYAVAHVGAGFMSVAFVFPILITYIIALIVGLEHLDFGRSSAVACGLSAGAILAIGKASAGDSGLLWIILTMTIPLFIAIGNIYRTMRWPPGGSSLSLAVLMLLGGTVVLLPFSLQFSPVIFYELVTSGRISWLLVAQIAIFSFLNVGLFALQKLAGPVYLSQIGSVGAVVGIVLAVGFLGETTPPNLWIAALFIGAAMILFHRVR